MVKYMMRWALLLAALAALPSAWEIAVLSQSRINPGGGSSSGGGGDGAIQDGASASIEATVLDYTSSNPLAVRLTDTNGDYVTAGGGTQYAVDAALGATPTGTLAVAIRDDALSALTPVEGDAIGLRVDANGALWIIPSGTTVVGDGGGSLTVDGSISCSNCSGSGASDVDDSSFTIATDSVAPAGFLFDDVTPDSVDEGDVGLARMSANRVPYAMLRDAAGNERGANVNVANELLVAASDGGGSLTVDGSVSLAAAIPAGTNNIGDVDVLSLPAIPAGANTIGNIASITASITPGTTASNLGKAEDNAAVTGDVGVSVLAIRRDTTPTSSAGTAGDYTAFNVDANGRLYTQTVLYNSSGSELTLATDQTEDSAEASGVAGPVILSVRRDTAATSAGTAGDYATVNTDALGRTWTRAGDPCADHARISSVAIATSSSGNTQLVALNGSDLVYVCGYSVVAGAATAVKFVYGTGTACATGQTDITGAWSFAANGGLTQANAGVPQFIAPAGQALCVNNSGANSIQGHVTYVRTAAP